VLIVDDEVNLRFTAERALRRAGHVADSASTVRQAMERLRGQPYDVVICDLKMPGGDGAELIEWVGSHTPSTRVLVVSAYITEELRGLYTISMGIRLVEKPVELATLVQLVEEIGARRGFYGNSIEVELFDYVQMIALSGRDKQILVSTPIGEGQIWFDHGDIIHAVYDEHEGEQAFYKMLAVGRGSFHEVFFREPPSRTIIGSSTHLLMEAARMMDEGTLGQDPQEIAEQAPAGDGESSFAGMAEEVEAEGEDTALPIDDDDDALILPDDDDEDQDTASVAVAPPPAVSAPPATEPTPEQSVTGMGLLDDPETRELMLGQFFEYEGVNGVAIVSSTGKVLAEDMRSNGALVTLAGFYMRGAARIARDLSHNVFDGIIAKSSTGQQLVIVGMGATSAVLSVEIGCDPEEVRKEVMGDDA
jgi:CheY-like chemotaxis protein